MIYRMVSPMTSVWRKAKRRGTKMPIYAHVRYESGVGIVVGNLCFTKDQCWIHCRLKGGRRPLFQDSRGRRLKP